MYKKIQNEFRKIVETHGLQEEEISCKIIARGFTSLPPPQLQRPKDIVEQHFKMPSKEYALTRGKEVIVRCEFKKSYGDAFTDKPKAWSGKLKKIHNLILGDKSDRAVYFAVLNTTLARLGFVEKAVHCKEDDPKRCGEELASYILRNFGNVRIAHIGYQPGHIETCAKYFENYVTDLNPENIGKVKFGREILSGNDNEEVIKKADVACITGSTIVGGDLPALLRWCEKYDTTPIIYGVTVVGAAKLLNLPHFCPFARSKP